MNSHSQTLASYYIGLVKLLMLTGLCIMPSEYYETTDALQKALQWNPSIVATIGERPSGLYRGVATSQGVLHDALCACAYECLAAPSRPSPVSRLFHASS